MTSRFHVIVALDTHRGIGHSGDLPWHLPKDLRYFQEVTSQVKDNGKRNAVVMGRKTWESIPEKYRPLKGRLNVVLTRQTGYVCGDGVPVASSLDEGLALADAPDVETVFVVGGGAIYRESMSHPKLHRAYLTEIEAAFDCDTFFPSLPAHFQEVSRSESIVENGTAYSFVVYEGR